MCDGLPLLIMADDHSGLLLVMRFQLEPLLSPEETESIRSRLESDLALWKTGTETAGRYARLVKNNQQLDRHTDLYEELQAIVLGALSSNLLFRAAALPLSTHGLLFSRYRAGDGYGRHVDNAYMPGGCSDLSFTLFLSERKAYRGGELVIESPQAEEWMRLDAGHAVVYPSGHLHRVEPVLEGVRYAAIGWIHSTVRSCEQRELLFELDTACKSLSAREGRSEELDLLYRCQTNLLRMWGC